MNKHDWINFNLDMINFFLHKLLKFINNYDKEFTLNTDLETFYNNFTDFLYNNYYLNLEFKDYTDYDRNFEYFESMYEDDIIDLFSEFKEIAYGFTSDIFKFRNEAYSLLEFIYENINLEEDYNILNDDVEEEYVEEEYY